MGLSQLIFFLPALPGKQSEPQRLYVNFFQPVLKLIAKERIGNKVVRKYAMAKTPCQRVTEREDVSLVRKAQLLNAYLCLNPAKLRNRIDQKVLQLWSTLSPQ